MPACGTGPLRGDGAVECVPDAVLRPREQRESVLGGAQFAAEFREPRVQGAGLPRADRVHCLAQVLGAASGSEVDEGCDGGGAGGVGVGGAGTPPVMRSGPSRSIRMPVTSPCSAAADSVGGSGSWAPGWWGRAAGAATGAVQADADAEGQVGWGRVSVDSTTCRGRRAGRRCAEARVEAGGWGCTGRRSGFVAGVCRASLRWQTPVVRAVCFRARTRRARSAGCGFVSPVPWVDEPIT